MKLKYPAEAFALGIILFSAGMKEAFAAGILVILTATFAEFLRNLLINAVPEWSLRPVSYTHLSCKDRNRRGTASCKL